MRTGLVGGGEGGGEGEGGRGGGKRDATQRQGQGRFGDWGALSPGHPHTAGRETDRDAAAQVETVASRTRSPACHPGVHIARL